MTFDDRSTYRQPDAHSALFGRVESLKESLGRVLTETNACILHGEANTIASIGFGPDRQLSGSIVDFAHRFGGVPNEIQNHLLKLDLVTGDRGKIVGELGTHDDVASLKVAQRNRDHCLRSFVEID